MESTDNDKVCSPEVLAVSKASNILALNLYPLLSKGGENVFFSPFSLSTAMSMVCCGSEKETLKEIQEVLGYEKVDINEENLKYSFHFLLKGIEDNKEEKFYTLACANSMFSRMDIDVKEEFKSLLEEYFNAQVQAVDFDREKTIEEINEWVNEKTNNMIPEIVKYPLPPNTAIIILNAIYFKGSWLNQFNAEFTVPQDFYNNGDEVNCKQVEMMHIEKTFPYVEKDSYKALNLPYEGGDIAMLVLLPSSNGLDQLESSLSSTFIQELKQEMHEMEVEVALPKFRLEYSESLVEHFRSLGMNQLFCPGADFSRISDVSPEFYVTDIIHKAVFLVNEEGSEASAATGVVFSACSTASLNPKFIVDHPFLFVIYNSKNNLILFMGRVNEL